MANTKSPKKNASGKAAIPSKQKGKGKEIKKVEAIIVEEIIVPAEAGNDLLTLAERIIQQAHFLAPGNQDSILLELANRVLKASFDRALESEILAFPHLSNLLESLIPSAGPSTRSKSKSRAEQKAELEAEETKLKLDKTPLQELTVGEGMDFEMVWEQMELRQVKVVGLLDEMFGGERDGSRPEDMEDFGETGPEGDNSDEEGEDDSEGSYEEGQSDSEQESEEGEEIPFEESSFTKSLTTAIPAFTSEFSDEEKEASDSSPPPADLDPTSGLTLATFDEPSFTTPKARKASGPPSVVDDAFFSLHDFHVQTDEGEFEMNKAMRGEYDEDDLEDDIDLFAEVEEEDDDGADLDNAGLMYNDFFEPPPRPFKEEKRPAKGKKGKGINPKPIKVVEEVISVKKVAVSNGKRSVKFSEIVKVKAIPARGSDFDKLVAKVGWEKADQLTRAQENGDEEEDEDEEKDEQILDGEVDDDMISDDDEEGERDEGEEDEMLKMIAEEMDEEMDGEEEEGSGEEEEEYESEDEEGRETIERLKKSLFDEDEISEDEGSTPAAALTKHERRLLDLSNQISDLESENVGAKNWATKGEAKSRDRPMNSLLEEDLEYERSGKVVPVITEETTKTIEDLIKKRILDNDFDDVVRQRAIDPNAFLPSRFMELQDSKSSKSLAEIYEEDFTNSRERDAGNKVVAKEDLELEKRHSEIEELFEELSGKLDALSNARFTPKPPKTAISTISNVASITLESALPTGSSTATLLAPEETFVPDPTNEDRSDFTPSMKKQARQKRRKARAAMAKSAEKFSSGEKGEKERAVKELVGTKGVTVIGKSGKKIGAGLKRGRENGDDGDQRGGAVRFKL